MILRELKKSIKKWDVGKNRDLLEFVGNDIIMRLKKITKIKFSFLREYEITNTYLVCMYCDKKFIKLTPEKMLQYMEGFDEEIQNSFKGNRCKCDKKSDYELGIEEVLMEDKIINYRNNTYRFFESSKQEYKIKAECDK